jgi:hypothetical protein
LTGKPLLKNCTIRCHEVVLDANESIMINVNIDCAQLTVKGEAEKIFVKGKTRIKCGKLLVVGESSELMIIKKGWGRGSFRIDSKQKEIGKRKISVSKKLTLEY